MEQLLFTLNEIEVAILLHQQLDKNNATVSFYYNAQHKAVTIARQRIVINAQISNSEPTDEDGASESIQILFNCKNAASRNWKKNLKA